MGISMALLLATIFVSILTQTWSLHLNFHNFSNDDESHFYPNDDYRITGGAIQVTLDAFVPITNLSGRAIYREQFRLRNKDKVTASFNTTFVLNISPPSETSPPVGEGLAFILAAEIPSPANSEGQWLGIVNASTNEMPAARIVAVEFDTRKSFSDDVDSNHVGLNVNSVFSIVQRPLSDFEVELSSGKDVHARVVYDGENISIYVSETEDQLMKNRVIFQPLNLSVLPDFVYVGFSASTSNFTQLNCLKSWEFHGTDFEDDTKNLLWVWITIPLVVLVISIGACLLCFWMRKKRKKTTEDVESNSAMKVDPSSLAPQTQKFGLTELKKATGNFNPKNRLGKGGFGTVYRGILINRVVAIKRVAEDSHQGEREFIAEVTIIGSLHHKNLVKLIGWCFEKKDLLLVYEFMPNGSLENLLFESVPSWERRHEIIRGVAEALDYLHNGCERTVLHRDVKSSNIMLDSNFEAKLGDFGLARTIRRTEETHHSTKEIAGTLGYMAPETFLTSRATAETDVYAFGVLVLEVICGRKPGNLYELGDYDGGIAQWVWEFRKNGAILEAVDARMEGDFNGEEMEEMLILGLGCCHPNPNERPTMRRVLQVLNGEATLKDLPKERPSFVWPPMPASFKEDVEHSQREIQLTQFTELTGR